MVATSMIQRLILLCQYPGFSRNLVGPYDNVGVIQGRIPGSSACQVFYPAALNTKNSYFLPYFRPRAIPGVAGFGGLDPEVVQFLSWKRHPCKVDAPIVEEEFPVVFFPHGLGGCMEMYTDICQQVASSGMIVVALEHEDGSGCFAENENGKVVNYKSPSSSEPYSRKKEVNFRKDFLEHRAKEVTKTMKFFLGGWRNQNSLDMSSNGVYGSSTDVWKQVLDKVDAKRGVALFGHSFGGATMVYTMHRDGEYDAKLLAMVNSITMLDPWAFALDTNMVEKGAQSSVPLFSILSENWVTSNSETEQVLELHVDNPDKLYYMPRSVHASFSDSPWWLPRLVSRPFRLRGKDEKRHKTIPACAKACIHHMKASIKRYEEGTKLDETKKEDINDQLAPLLPFPYATTKLKLPEKQQLSPQDV